MTENLAKANALKYKTYPDRKLVFISAFESKCLRSDFFLWLGSRYTGQANLSVLPRFAQPLWHSSLCGGTEIHPEFPIFSR